MMQNKVFILIFIALVFILGGLLYIYNPDPVKYGDTGEQMVCAQDAKLCPDGSYVGRVAPNCDFETCPIPNEPVFEDGTLDNPNGDNSGDTLNKGAYDPLPPQACTMEAKQCPDGSYVGRSGPNCEFAPCP